MLEEFCCHVHVQQARQGGGGLTASYKVSEDVMYSLRMTSQTLDNVVQVAKNLCEVTGQDLNARFAHVGITKFFYVCNPQYKENQLFQPAMKAMAAHFGFEEQTLTEEWRHMLSAKERYLLHYPEKRTVLPFLSLVFFPRASMPVLFKSCAKNVQS